MRCCLCVEHGVGHTPAEPAWQGADARRSPLISDCMPIGSDSWRGARPIMPTTGAGYMMPAIAGQANGTAAPKFAHGFEEAYGHRGRRTTASGTLWQDNLSYGAQPYCIGSDAVCQVASSGGERAGDITWPRWAAHVARRGLAQREPGRAPVLLDRAVACPPERADAVRCHGCRGRPLAARRRDGHGLPGYGSDAGGALRRRDDRRGPHADDRSPATRVNAH